MKLIWSLSVASLILILGALFLPYTRTENSAYMTEVMGREHFPAIFQLIFTALILVISTRVRNKITAVISFSLCFGFSIFFVFLTYSLYPTYLPDDSTFSYSIGFYTAILSAVLCWGAHLLNVINMYRVEFKKERTE